VLLCRDGVCIGERLERRHMQIARIKFNLFADRSLSHNRRNILLGGTTLAAVTALAASTPLQTAQGQQQQSGAPAAGQKPNILVIFGDDIGVPQISAYTMGLDCMSPPQMRRLTLDVVTRVTRMDRAEPQTREGESWVIILRPLSESIRQNRVMQ
jgi:hypothetical protein